jgi:ribosomal protein S18 acetylase RimI-like enzyme
MLASAIPSTIAIVRPAEEERALASLVLAFANDPAMRWMYPEAHQFRLFFPRFVRALAGEAFGRETALRLDDFRGSALWLAPGVMPHAGALTGIVEETVEPGKRGPACALFEQMNAQRPTDPHWHLPLIGIDPRHQGLGLGSTLLRHHLSACDRVGHLAWLVASNPRNISFYTRHGFISHGEIRAGESPTLMSMIRAPRESQVPAS